ncbi:MAG: O-antigen ligase family protein [Flavipsychrobacter sp.]
MAKLSLNSKYAYGLSLPQGLILLVIGLVCALFPVLTTLIIVGILLFTVYAFLKQRIDWIWYAIAASPFFEVWGRMSRAPGVPDEIGKYFLLLAMLLIFLHNSTKGAYQPLHKAGIAIVLMIIPSLIVATSVFNLDQWIFNALGILELGLLLMLISKERWTVERFCKTLQFGILPIFFILVFLTFKTPTYDNVDFQLGANSAASGGFGSNQVSTILGLGIVYAVLLVILKRPIFSVKLVNYFLIGFLLFRGLLTFSRGGMVGAALAVFIALIPSLFASSKAFFRYSLMALGIGVLGTVIFIQANKISGNMLLLRYEGETKETLSGAKDKTLNKITSGRYNVFIADWKIFMDNFLFGVGPGVAKAERAKYAEVHEATAAHTEYTRLLSEHGFGGAIVCFILSLFPLYWVPKQRVKVWRGISAALFTISVLTSMHAAMRTNTTTVCYALAAIPLFVKSSNIKKKTTVEIPTVE